MYHPYPIPEGDMDNILVNQKDVILGYFNEKEYALAMSALELLRELWEAHNYLYKYEEIRERIEKERNA